jgi:ribulose-phosphate 3-epimerase
MSVVVPAILVRTRAEIEAQLALIKGLVDTVQIDVVDGVLAGKPTWPYTEGGLTGFAPGFDIHEMGSFKFEMDLMVREPREAMATFLKAGAGKLILHAESTRDIGALLDELETTYGRDKEFSPDLLSVALALHADANITHLAPHLARVDYVQFMGIAHEGLQGQPFNERVLDAIVELRKNFPDLLIQVDGGVSLETAPRLLSAGVNRLVVGSALWKSGDIPGTIHKFTELIEEYGRYKYRVRYTLRNGSYGQRGSVH